MMVLSLVSLPHGDSEANNNTIPSVNHEHRWYFFHNDHLGVPRKITDMDAGVVWSARYKAFGEAIIEIEGVTNHLRFPGQYFDKETGLFYNWHRYYDPYTGRYLTSDPLGLVDGPNTYAYVKSNPVNYVDPTGEITQAASNTLTYGALGFAAFCGLFPSHPSCKAARDAIEQCLNDWIPPWEDTGPDPLDTPEEKPSPSDSKAEQKKNCTKLKNSILSTCAGLTGRAKFRCFEAANTSYRQCMGFE